MGLLLMGRWFVTNSPADVKRVLSRLLVTLGVLFLVYLLVTGRAGLALMALPLLVPWLLRLRARTRAWRVASGLGGAGSGGTGQTSEIRTRFLAMTLEHASGAMTGVVLEGPQAGRSLETLTDGEMATLIVACRRGDADSLRVLEAYLDRDRPGWRTWSASNEEGRETSSSRPGDGFADGAMDRDEAYRILGLRPGASAEEIKRAYHRLMGAVHPDHGGSDYLAAKINQAKAVLLND